MPELEANTARSQARDTARSQIAVAVVCDGCSSGESSEVGARLGAELFACSLGARLQWGESVVDLETWDAARTDVVATLAQLLERIGGDRADVIRAQLLFTVVAAAISGDEAAVWALGDGVYCIDGCTRELGPFEDNAPPYLGYDLLGDRRPAHFEVVARASAIVIGTDGATEVPGGIGRFGDARYLANPDALRRELAILARGEERIDWDARHVIRSPAALQDDCAIAVLLREVAS